MLKGQRRAQQGATQTRTKDDDDESFIVRLGRLAPRIELVVGH